MEKEFTELKNRISGYYKSCENRDESQKLAEMFKEHPRWKNDPEMLKAVGNLANLESIQKLVDTHKEVVIADLFLFFDYIFMASEFKGKENTPEGKRFASITKEYISLFSEWLVKVPETKDHYLKHVKMKNNVKE